MSALSSVKTGNAHFRKRTDKAKRAAVTILKTPGATVLVLENHVKSS